MRSCNGFHSHESPNPPSSRVGDVVAMLQIEFSGIGNHGVAEAAGFQRCKGVFLAPHPVDFIEILGADGPVCLLYTSLNHIFIPYDRDKVFLHKHRNAAVSYTHLVKLKITCFVVCLLE